MTVTEEQEPKQAQYQKHFQTSACSTFANTPLAEAPTGLSLHSAGARCGFLAKAAGTGVLRSFCAAFSNSAFSLQPLGSGRLAGVLPGLLKHAIPDYLARGTDLFSI